jgi:release factor glutamine methyltransferase
MDISQALDNAGSALAQAGVATPRSEAASLLRSVLRKDAVFLIAHPDSELTDLEHDDFMVAVSRRCQREPFHYITGSREFFALEFGVAPGVLIPRPETEILVEAAIETLRGRKNPRFCEIGIGTGCVAVSILNAVPQAFCIAVDISDPALELAALNAARHGVDKRLTLVRGDLFGTARGPFDLVVSNPPYKPDPDFDDLQPEVKFEPREALLGGPDGLAVIRRLISESPAVLADGGILLIEFGFGQAERVTEMFDKDVWMDVEVLPDLQGIPRVIKALLKATRASMP